MGRIPWPASIDSTCGGIEVYEYFSPVDMVEELNRVLAEPPNQPIGIKSVAPRGGMGV